MHVDRDALKIQIGFAAVQQSTPDRSIMPNSQACVVPATIVVSAINPVTAGRLL